MKYHVNLILLGLFMLIQMPVKSQTLVLEHTDYSSATGLFSFQDFNIDVREVGGAPYTVVTFKGSAPSQRLGAPDLPVFSQIVEVPLCSDVSVEVSKVQTQLLDSRPCKYPMMPVQPSPSKSDRETPPFVIDSALYAADSFYANPMAWIEPIGVARDRNLVNLRISPLAYNPVTGQLMQITSMEVTLKYKNADIAATQRLHTLYHSPDFSIGHEALYALPMAKEVRRDAPVHYLIVAHSSFRGQLDSLINWKKRTGYIVTVGYTDDPLVGTSNTQIASYIKSFYTNATEQLPAPTYLLLVGDHQQIPAFSARCGSPATDHITDLYFTTWTEGDHIPDCYYGRFSARNVAELTPQIEKTIFYESYGFPDDSYLGKGVLIAGVDQRSTADNAYRYADPSMDYVASTYLHAGNRYTNVYYYKNNISFAPTGVTVTGSSQTNNTAGTLLSLYNAGCGWVNYTAHGYDDSWSIPSFSTSDVSSMTNSNRPSIMIGNCCLSGRFNTDRYDQCLGEALLRKAGNAGAAAYIGGTNSTYWPEDFCWAVGVRTNISNQMNTAYDAANLGVYDRLFHTHNESYDNWYTSMGSVVTAGNMAVQALGSSRAYYYWEIYELFGDPSLKPWLGRARTMSVSAPSTIAVTSRTYNATVPSHAYVALVNPQDLSLLCAAYANADGDVVLNLPADLTVGTYQLAVTAQNYKPYFQNVETIVVDGPYIVISDFQPTGGKLIPGQPTTFDITLKNIGNQHLSQGTVNLFSSDRGVAISRAEERFGSIAPGDSVRLTGLWLTYIPEQYADNSLLQFNTEVVFGEGSSSRRFRFFTTAPQLDLVRAESQTILYPDSSNVITCNLVNNGHDTTPALTLLLPNLFGFMDGQPAAQPLGPLAPGQSALVSFPVRMASGLPNTSLRFLLQAVDGADTSTVGTFTIPCGYSAAEDFETGDFTRFSWGHGTYPWVITSENPFRGSFSARSALNLGNRRESRLNLQWVSTADDSISFQVKVSSEENYDLFHFFIDGQLFYTASGEQDWTRVSFPVAAGSHIFSFSYQKDYSTVGGDDCAKVDDICLPFSGSLVNYVVDTVCQGDEYQFAGEQIPTDEVGHLSRTDTINSTYLSLQVVQRPEVQIEVIGNLALGNCVLLKATGATHYNWSTGDTLQCIGVCPDQGSSYEVTGCQAGCCNTARITVLGIDQASAQTGATLYPNPATGRVTVEADQLKTVRLVNMVGQTLFTLRATGSAVTIPLNNVPSGVYFVTVETAQALTTHKLLVK